ncbi:serine--tRNA ligase [Candidatus Kaiserbacteria bacterium RIFCSPLOWO2_01_FULL_54_24]|uniref:Serine--tRNA ligase n=1 Tax=Candidatus Kaiserbacteria bacterium RIFCSPLOWO2_01_FULL_54_24 TaxID=1798515 RepID=A0A1F6ETM5_9BACT|nr:MAG: serine--tRNA ligase [Candidatus Kaiserbacteria bacterium RIFCSPLOWO2_01_FULL_54_24]
MLDIKFIRENKDIVAAGAKKKRVDVDLGKLLSLDDKRRELQAKIDERRAEQNVASNAIASAKADTERQAIISKMQEVKETLRLEEESMQEILKEWRALMVQVPNVPDVSVPDGESDADNKEVRAWGEIPTFDFEPKSHTELLLLHDMADYERGAKVAGFRGYFLKNDGARLVWALHHFVEERFVQLGFTPMVVPSVVRREAFVGTGYLPQSEEDLYKTQDGDYLAGTAEVATMGYYMDEMLEKKDLPLKFVSFSPCFRREAGSHGKDTKGIFRIHEFLKYEQVVLCEANHEESVKWHEELTKNAEELLQALALPYHVVINCGADLGLGQVKKYDIEAWMPSEKKYRETHSSSYFHDFQTRRLNIRYRDDGGVVRYVHSLNNTALATPRILCQIVENNQQADGSITIPQALRGYMGKDAITKNS